MIAQRLLARRGVTFQRTKTWKESPDPERGTKPDRIEHVPDRFPDRVSAFDGFGPLGIRPTAGSGRAERQHPDRLPAYASWANPIEAHFGPLRQFTVTNSNHPNHTVQTRALHACLRWRNANARHRDILAVERKERARIRRDKGIRWGGRQRAGHSPGRPTACHHGLILAS